MREGFKKIKLGMRRIRGGEACCLTFRDLFGHASVNPQHLHPGLQDTVGTICFVELQ